MKTTEGVDVVYHRSRLAAVAGAVLSLAFAVRCNVTVKD
jgi:hypothetical protein